jgi:hypothetical protein
MVSRRMAVGRGHHGDTWILVVVRWRLAREWDGSDDKLSTTFRNNTAIASSGIGSTYFDYAQITIKLYPSLHQYSPPDFGFIPGLLSGMDAMFAVHDGTYSCLWHLLLRVGALRTRLYGT